MEHNTVELNDKPIHDGQTLMVDHTVKTFTVTIRSMTNVSESTLKDLIQRKYEVVDIKAVRQTDYVHAMHGW